MLIIRRGVANDAAALAEFSARTFTDTYAAHNTAANLRAHLDTAFGVPQQTRELTDPAASTVIAEWSGAIAGYAQLRRAPAPSCVTAEAPIEIHRFYVDRSAHGTGLAALLMTEAHRAAWALGGRHVWLGVWERNARAIAFYRKSGFVDVGTQDFFVGADRQTDRVVVMPVLPDGAPVGRGLPGSELPRVFHDE